MPPEARVFIAEDDHEWQGILQRQLENAGHTVISMAENLPDALESVRSFDELSIQVAILDGNLSKASKDGSDGQTLLQKIKETSPSVKTIGMSGLILEGVDIDLGKHKAFKLGEIVTEL